MQCQSNVSTQSQVSWNIDKICRSWNKAWMEEIPGNIFVTGLICGSIINIWTIDPFLSLDRVTFLYQCGIKLSQSDMASMDQPNMTVDSTLTSMGTHKILFRSFTLTLSPLSQTTNQRLVLHFLCLHSTLQHPVKLEGSSKLESVPCNECLTGQQSVWWQLFNFQFSHLRSVSNPAPIRS